MIQWGFQVRTAENGKVALEVWETWVPDVIWMDLLMPQMGGVEAVLELRSLEKASGRKKTLVFAISASVLDMDRESLLGQGFDEFILKPFRESQIAEVLERVGGMRFRSGDVLEGQGVSLSAEDLKSLPQDWRKAFREALLLGDSDEAMRCVNGLGADPRAGMFRLMVAGYRFEELLRLMEGLKVAHR